MNRNWCNHDPLSKALALDFDVASQPGIFSESETLFVVCKDGECRCLRCGSIAMYAGGIGYWCNSNDCLPEPGLGKATPYAKWKAAKDKMSAAIVLEEQA